jgi:hypothetical protein
MKELPVSIEQEAGWVVKPVWLFCRKEFVGVMCPFPCFRELT